MVVTEEAKTMVYGSPGRWGVRDQTVHRMPVSWFVMCWEVWATCRKRSFEEKQASVVRVWKKKAYISRKRKHILAGEVRRTGFIIQLKICFFMDGRPS